MFQNFIKTGIVFTAIFLTQSISAKSYAFGSFGMQFDLGQLTGTIEKDGLDATNYYPVSATEVQRVLRLEEW
uniref:porin OmpL1 n=1 Tax=Leptospira ainazelensis TaxID=2810034 RepID=UPI001E3721FB|nr:porin OmpL1 [Leptospira ainazelensis]